jgi:hypothetical protein
MNWDAYNEVLAHLEAHPEEFDQEWPHLSVPRKGVTGFPHIGGPCGCFGAHVRNRFGTEKGEKWIRRNPSVRGGAAGAFGALQLYLGATVEQASYLFAAFRTLQDFRNFRDSGGVVPCVDFEQEWQ